MVTVDEIAVGGTFRDLFECDRRLIHGMRASGIGAIPMLAVVDTAGALLAWANWAETITMRAANLKKRTGAGMQLLGTTLL